MADIIDGKAIAATIAAEVATGVQTLAADGIVPGLAVVLVGEDPASQVYVGRKLAQTRKVGIRSFENRLPAETAEHTLLALIDRLNHDPEVHGILVQLPLPKHTFAFRNASPVCAVLAIAAGLFSIAAFSVADRSLSLILFAAFGFAAGGTYAPTIALFQERSPTQTRAFGAAVMLLVAIFLGQGGGPFVVGILSDYFGNDGHGQSLEWALVLASTSLLFSAAFLLDALRVLRKCKSGLEISG